MAAGTLVPEGMEIPPRSLVMGLPGKVRRPITDEEREGLRRVRARTTSSTRRRYLAERSGSVGAMAMQAVKGTKDILPDEIAAWHRIERDGPRAVRPLRLPRDPHADLRGDASSSPAASAQETDIVSKEMYTFEDRDGAIADPAPGGDGRHRARGDRAQPHQHRPARSRSTRSGRCSAASGRRRAATASSTRSTSRPSASPAPPWTSRSSRWRSPTSRACGLARVRARPELRGRRASAGRPTWRRCARRCAPAGAQLCADCQRRTETNPLRVLDCKVPQDQAVIEALPQISDHLCDECRDHFAEVRRELELLGIPYRLSHRLVRGLDYYMRTTFEVRERRAGRAEQRARAAAATTGW